MLIPFQEDFLGHQLNNFLCEEYTGYSCEKLIKLSGINGLINFEDLENWNITGMYPEIKIDILSSDTE